MSRYGRKQCRAWKLLFRSRQTGKCLVDSETVAKSLRQHMRVNTGQFGPVSEYLGITFYRHYVVMVLVIMLYVAEQWPQSIWKWKKQNKLETRRIVVIFYIKRLQNFPFQSRPTALHPTIFSLKAENVVTYQEVELFSLSLFFSSLGFCAKSLSA